MAYVNAFDNTVEYCDQNREQVIESTADVLSRFFRGDEGQPVPGFMGEISTLDGHSVAGGALTVNVGSYYMLEMLYVHPSWQRQGIASGLLCNLMNKISGKAIPLISRYNLANILVKIGTESAALKIYRIFNLPAYIIIVLSMNRSVIIH
jgi:GNAT superfamily N-acetyltransferase